MENRYQRLDTYKVPNGFRQKPGWYAQLWQLVYAIFFRTSPHFLNGWRCFLLRCFGAKLGKGVVVRPTARFFFPWKVKIGDFSWVGDEVELYSLGEMEIGSHTVISQRCYLCGGGHDYKDIDFSLSFPKMTIGNEVWLATDVFVAPGVSIGDGTVVGARSSVFKDLPSGKICFGNPAKVVRDR